MGHSSHVATFLGAPDGVRHISSDLAFEGKLAFRGNFDGFRVIDVSSPARPREIVHERCNGDQGDIVVWEDILVRSWNSKKAVAGAWSSYYYDNFIYGSEITKGLNVFRVSDKLLGGAIRLGRLNPQTQEFSLDG